MADYKIAPDSTGIISLGAMRKSLDASADYNASSKHTTASTSVNTLVGTPATYQSNVDSFTWSTTNPKGFQEMYGKTWSDGSGGTTPATLSYSFSGGTLSATIRKNNSSGTILLNHSGGATSGTISSGINSGDTIWVTSSATFTGEQGSMTARYRVPNSGTYTVLYAQTSGNTGGQVSGTGTFTITSGQTTAGLNIELLA